MGGTLPVRQVTTYFPRIYTDVYSDPWWIFTVCSLFWNIKSRYEFSIFEIVKVSPRFGILLLAMLLSIAFIILDILSVTHVIAGPGLPDGINPFWKLSFAFKCLTDTVILDDFKTALDRLKRYKLQQIGTAWSMSIGGQKDPSNPSGRSKKSQQRQEQMASPLQESQTKMTGNWETDIERLDFCTVPESVYLGKTRSSESRSSGPSPV